MTSLFLFHVFFILRELNVGEVGVWYLFDRRYFDQGPLVFQPLATGFPHLSLKLKRPVYDPNFSSRLPQPPMDRSRT